MLLILAIIQVVLLLISNIIAAKTFSLFTIHSVDVSLPCAVFLFPLIYVISDVISEVYKYRWSRRVCWMSFAMNLLMVVCFEITIVVPGSIDMSVLGSTWFLLIASLLSFIVGGWVNDIIFKQMKIATRGKKITARILVSSVCGQFVDSLIYIPLGMYIFPKYVLGFAFLSVQQVLLCVLIQPLFKFVIECVVAPFTKKMCLVLNKAEYEAGNIYGDSDENLIEQND